VTAPLYEGGSLDSQRVAQKPAARERYKPTSPRACCDKAVRVRCVCEASWDCPVHGQWCWGSHD